MSQQKENNPHYLGHRQRLRSRYIEKGIDSLLEHEIIELILFYAMPRVDTKPLAHKLLDAYGSLEAVLGASYESLREFGLSENSAVLFPLYSDIKSWMNRRNANGRSFEKYEEIGLLMVNELENSPSEKLVMLLLDSKNKVISLKMVCEGSFKATHINLKGINEEIVLRKAAKVVLAHNHPSGRLQPSTDDITTTDFIENYLSYTGVELVEHYIVAEGTYLGIKHARKNMEKEKELLYRSGLGIKE